MVTRLGRNLGGRAQSSRKGGWGKLAGTGHLLSTEPISPQSETWLWIPRRPPHQVIRAVPLRLLLFAAFESGSWPGRFDFWPSPRARFFLPLSIPSPCFPPSCLSRAGWQSRGGAACPRPEIKSPPGIDISPQAGGGSCWGCFLFRGFVLFLFVSREFSFHYLRVFCFGCFACVFFVDFILEGLAL